MRSRDSTDLIARVAQALADSSPERALQAVLELLKDAGLVVAEQASDEAWLNVQHGTRRLHLCASGEAPDECVRAPLAHLLRQGLARCADREHFERAKERMALLSSASFEGLFFHLRGHVFDVNQRLADMLGYEPHELLGDTNLMRCIAPEHVAEVRRRIAARSEGPYMVEAVRKDGSRFTAELRATTGMLGDRSVRVVAVRDVTDRERAQQLLRESEMRLRGLVEQTFDFTIYTRDAVIVDVAGPLERVLGYEPKEVIGQNSLNFVDPTIKQRFSRAFGAQSNGSYESIILAKNGERVPVEVVWVRSSFEGKPVRVSAARDLRPLKRLEEEKQRLQQDFERSQRLDSLGVLAGGIAHDFNNILVGILGYADLLHEHVQSNLGRELLQGILDASHRAAGLTAQMLAYAGRKELGPRTPVDLGELLEELRGLLSATLSKKARLSISADEGLIVLGNRATLTQVLMNLLTNASDALGDEAGVISVRLTRVDEPDGHFSRALGANLGGRVDGDFWVLLEVSDSGVGMDEQTQARIFEPFFTTKHKGHGLGLAACLGIVSAHGGAIVVDSAPGRGSTFRVLLPGHATVATRSPPRTEVPTHRAPGQRILVVDDEALVRSQLRIALTARGYHVDEATGGNAALSVLLDRAEGELPDLVILDVTMPDLSGVEVLRRLRAQGCRVPVVLSSGYHDAALDVRPDLYAGFLVKPYRLTDIYEAVEGALQPDNP